MAEKRADGEWASVEMREGKGARLLRAAELLIRPSSDAWRLCMCVETRWWQDVVILLCTQIQWTFFFRHEDYLSIRSLWWGLKLISALVRHRV